MSNISTTTASTTMAATTKATTKTFIPQAKWPGLCQTRRQTPIDLPDDLTKYSQKKSVKNARSKYKYDSHKLKLKIIN